MTITLIPDDVAVLGPWREAELRAAAGADGRAYCGFRIKGVHVYRIVAATAGAPLMATALRHEMRHSPDGFEWGYGGSGPSDLALSILTEHINSLLQRLYGGGCVPPITARNEALAATRELYQAFKWATVAKFSRERWLLPGEDVTAWLRAQLDNLLVTAETRRFLTVLLAGAGEISIELDDQEKGDPEEAAR